MSIRPEGKSRILLGVSGSIAAYKTPELVRLWVKMGYSVNVILTDAAADFVSPLSLATVAKTPVLRHYYEAETGVWTNHVALAEWAHAFVLAPASAQTLAKMAHGFSDNLLLTTYLSYTGPFFVAPAMDRDMYRHEATQQNLERVLQRPGHYLLPPGEGELASGLSGVGRMAEPAEIARTVADFMHEVHPQRLHGKSVMVTAGPTHEPLDPVRFLGNRSSGRMGYAIAEALVKEGAIVHLISGPVSLTPPGEVQYTPVETAQEMYTAAAEAWPKVDAAVMTAAVADYRPSEAHSHKMKKATQPSGAPLTLELVQNPDILATLGTQKQAGQVLVGFSLETHNALVNARQKRQQKGCDLMVMNTLEDEGAGFGHVTNKVTLITDHEEHELPLQSKTETARAIVDYLIVHYFS